MAAAEEADEDPLEHRVLADGDPPDLEQDGLAGRARIGRVGEGTQVGGGLRRVARVGHVRSPKSGDGRHRMESAVPRRSRTRLKVC